MSGRYFITATGTGVGKTLVTSALVWQFKRAGRKVRAVKPVISGFDPASIATSDTGQLLAAQGLEATMLHAEQCSPWRFAAPLSPDIAAELEGKTIDLQAVAVFCKAQESAEILLVEGVGGVMVPLNTEHTVLHWMQTLRYKIILVAGSYLGSISHTLTAVEVLKHAGMDVHAIVISESAESPVGLPQLLTTLRRFIPQHVNIITIPRLDYSQKLWENVPDIITGMIT